jgi:hypothetical protein
MMPTDDSVSRTAVIPMGGDEDGTHTLSPPTPRDVMLFAASATGVPIAALLLRYGGRRGGLLLESASVMLGLRAATMVAAGAGGRLRAVPRLLLYTETVLDGIAMVFGFWAWIWKPLLHPKRRSPMAHAWVAPLAITSWIAASVVHTARMANYISPDHGLRTSATDSVVRTEAHQFVRQPTGAING